MTSESPKTAFRPHVRTLADLDATWCTLIKPLGFGSRQIFAIMIDRDGEVVPGIVNVTDCPRRPDEEMVGGLVGALRQALDGVDRQGSCAVLWARPTSAGTRETDLQWARALATTMRERSLAHWPVYCADDFVMRVVAPDDLAAPS